MGPVHTQDSSTKSDNRPSTRSTEANSCPASAPSKSSSTDSQFPVDRSRTKTCSTGGKNSAAKRQRPPSPPKRYSRARKSLNFDSESVPSKDFPNRRSEEPFDLLQLDTKAEQTDETRNLYPEDRSEPGSKLPEEDDSRVPFLLLGPSDLLTSNSQSTRRSQRITLKKLEEGQSSLKTVEAGPGPTVNFSIPLSCPPSQTPDQSSDYGTASEHSFNHSQNQDNRSSQGPSRSRSTEDDHTSQRRRRRSRTTVKNQEQERPVILTPDYLSESSDDDGYLDAETSRSQPWEDDEDANLSVHSLPSGKDQWDKQMEEEESQHSISSDTSFRSFMALPTTALINATFASHRRILLLAPLEGYDSPPAPSISTRSQNNLFNLDETGSRLSKRKRRLLPAKSPFSIETFSNIVPEDGLIRDFGLRIIVASPVVALKPFGTKFSPTLSAIVSIPVDVDPAQGDEFYCLFNNKPSALDKRQASSIDWRVLSDENGNALKLGYEDGRVTFEISEFCYLLIVIRNKYSDIEVTKKVCARIGGKLFLPSEAMDFVQVDFPKGSLETDVTARVKLFFDTETNWADFFHKRPSLDPSKSALASPIIMVEPHGIKFNQVKCGDSNNGHGVTIQLPVPDYDYIMSNFGHLDPKLTIWQSCTSENEESRWEILDIPYNISAIIRGNISTTVISFQVEHFSFFRVVWNIISASLYEARVGMSYLYPYVSFSMKCQANMQENPDAKRFGLEVICYRSDKILPEITNYPHRVGSCNKPKLVRPGRIIIRLKSKFFEQDDEAGEDENGMVKEECDFRGRDFEMQYALRFKESVTVGRGTFGKVIVKRYIRQREEEPLFEFNLQKYGCEGEQTPHDQNDRWSIVALQELAGNLFITADDNWKIFAKALGFTHQEIKRNLKYAPDPFIAILNLYQARGGTPNEFVTALYSVNRQLKLGGGTSPTGSKKSISSQGSSGLGSSAGRYEESDSDTSGTQISQDSVLNGSMRKRSNPSINRSKGSSSANSKRAKRGPPPKLPKYKKDSSDESGESDEDDDESNASENEDAGGKALSDTTSLLHRRDMTKLEQTYLWDVSAYLDTLSWRNLARTLGVDEPSIVNIEHLHKSNGLRECAYQMLIFWREKFPKQCTYGVLYQALCKEGMNAVAKKMRLVSRNDKP